MKHCRVSSNPDLRLAVQTIYIFTASKLPKYDSAILQDFLRVLSVPDLSTVRVDEKVMIRNRYNRISHQETLRKFMLLTVLR